MLRNTALAGFGVWTVSAGATGAENRSPNEKLNIAGIGVGGQGAWNIGNCAGENVVALCDVDERRVKGSFERFPKAKKYRDFRKLLDEMGNQIDAVLVATPDHIHAPAAVAAMKMGKHCYCEKPLAHTVSEVRMMIELANKNKLATQMGTQIHAGANYRRVVELVQVGGDRAGGRSPRLAPGWLRRRRPPQGHSARAAGTRLGPLARPGPCAALSSLLLAGHLAELVGLRQRRPGRLWLPLHGPAVLGLEAAASDDGRDRRPAAAPRADFARPDRALRIPGPRRPAAREDDVVRRRQTSRLPRRTQDSGRGAPPCCSSARRGC